MAKQIIAASATDHDTDMTAIAVRPAIAIIDVDLDFLPLRKPAVCGKLSFLSNNQHGMPGGDMIVGTENFRDTKFQMLQVDINAPTIGAEIFSAPVLRSTII